jgi:hypothetical protein
MPTGRSSIRVGRLVGLSGEPDATGRGTKMNLVELVVGVVVIFFAFGAAMGALLVGRGGNRRRRG